MDTMNTNVEYQNCSGFRLWLRRIGIQIWWCVVFVSFWAVYNTLLVEPIPYSSKAPVDTDGVLQRFGWLFEAIGQHLGLFQLSPKLISEYGLVPTLWLFAGRIYSLLFLPLSIHCAWSFLIARVPRIEYTSATGSKSGKNPLSSVIGTINHVRQVRPRVHCMCVRLLTRGDKAAQPLAGKAITRAVEILSEMLDCEHLKIHIVTQTRYLDEDTKRTWHQLGATEVEERFVPPNYATRRGTLFKARNICFWQEMCGGVGRECDETRSWILSLDEESVITRPLVTEFIDKVINSSDEPRVGYALGFATFDTSMYQTSLIAKIFQSRYLAGHYIFQMKSKDDVLGSRCFHGGAYFARASVDRLVGNDVGPFASVSDDYALGLAAREKEVGIKALDGWFIEGPAPNLRGYIIQQARILRGQIYATYHMKVSRKEALFQTYRMILLSTYGMLQVCYYGAAFFIAHPAGSSCPLLDMIFLFVICTPIVFICFGAAYMQMPDKDAVVCILISPVFVLFVEPVIQSILHFWAIICVLKDWRKGNTTYETTLNSGKNVSSGFINESKLD